MRRPVPRLRHAWPDRSGWSKYLSRQRKYNNTNSNDIAMVSTASPNSETSIQLVTGLTEDDSARVLEALAFVTPFYQGRIVVTGQPALDFSEGVAITLALLKTDAQTRIAGLLFEL